MRMTSLGHADRFGLKQEGGIRKLIHSL
jgi:hypothetical protein